MRMIEELYYGKININERDIEPNSREKVLLEFSCKNDQEFRKKLPYDLLKDFDNYTSRENMLRNEFECEAFIHGFKLGLRFAFEGFSKDLYAEPSETELEELKNKYSEFFKEEKLPHSF